MPQSVIRKRKATEKTDAARKARTAVLKAATKKRQTEAFKHAESYVKEYAAQENEGIRLRRAARKAGEFYVPADPKIAFVIRIRGIMGVHPKTRKILQLLRLRQIHNGVFVKLNHATITMLRWVEPFIAYGYPNLKSVKDLVYKRGFVKVNKQRIAITDNSIIEDKLGKFGIICVGTSAAAAAAAAAAAGDTARDASSSHARPPLSPPRRGHHPRDLHLRRQLQGGQQLPVALQALVAPGRLHQAHQPLQRGRRGWCPRGQDQHPHQAAAVSSDLGPILKNRKDEESRYLVIYMF